MSDDDDDDDDEVDDILNIDEFTKYDYINYKKLNKRII
jgi:hypothetical protein